jgi:hypothetical protein
VAGGGQSGGLLGGRYELIGRAREAVDSWSGLPVVLYGVPLPETVEASVEYGVEDAVEDDGPGTPNAVPAPRGRPGAQPPEESAAERAVRVAADAVAAAPRHPRLVELYDSVASGAYLYLVGERVAGVPLSLLLERGPLSPYRAAEIASDVAGALRAVHATGRRHGNVTADTVLVCEDGSALLGGLGVDAAQGALCDGPEGGVSHGSWGPVRRRARDARFVLIGPVAERWAPELAGPGVADAVGQVGPERRGGQDSAWVVDTLGDAEPGPAPDGPPSGEEVGPAADAWALGVLLYRMTTGQAPFEEAGEESWEAGGELLDAVRSGTHASASGCGPLRPLVEELLRTDPGARPELSAVAERLGGLLARAPEPLNPDGALAVGELLAGETGLDATDAAAVAGHGRHARPHGHGYGHGRQRGRADGEGGGRVPVPRGGDGQDGDARSGSGAAAGGAPKRRGARVLGPLLVGGVLLLMVQAMVVIAVWGGRH